MDLSDVQLDALRELLPGAPPEPREERPRCGRRNAIARILWTLDNGAKWRDLPAGLDTRCSLHRALRRWAGMGAFEQAHASLGWRVRERDGFKLDECLVDRTFPKAKERGPKVGCARAGLSGGGALGALVGHSVGRLAKAGSAVTPEGGARMAVARSA